MTDLRCVDKVCDDGPRDDDQQPRPRWATTGLLCTRCAGLLEQRLAELPSRRDQLRASLAGRTRGAAERRGAAGWPVPLDVDAHDLLTALHATVVSWVRLVCEERALRGPDRDDVAVLAPWLLAQLDWLVEQPWVDDLADEMRDAARSADALTRVHAKRHTLSAPCPECGAQELGRRDGSSSVDCAACGKSWQEHEYRWLVLVLASDRGTSMTAAEAAERAEVTQSTFRQWVSRGLVRRLGTVDGAARYSTLDLDGVLTRRAETDAESCA